MYIKSFYRHMVITKFRFHRRKILALFIICIASFAYFSKDHDFGIKDLTKNLSLGLTLTIDLQTMNLKEVYRKKLEKEIIELSVQKHPKPASLKIIIVSTWRSGSTFLNDILSSVRGSFNNYEPLNYLGTKVFRNRFDKEGLRVQQFLQGVLNCRYDDDAFFEHFNGTELIEKKYQTLAKICNKEEYKSTCYEKTFMEFSCSLFPINVIKTVRVGLSLIEPFLEKSRNLHVIYLVRDPRAIMASRMSDGVVFCESPDCIDPSILCVQLSDDYDEFLKLSNTYPQKVHFIKYEELAISPLKVVKNLMEKMNLSVTSDIEQFIANHTAKEEEGEFSTYKIASKHVTSWQGLLDATNFTYIQSACSFYLKKVNYQMFTAAELAAKPFNYLDIINNLNRKLFSNYSAKK